MIPIRGYESEYTIAVDGTVTRIQTGKNLKPTINKQTGYLYYSLWKNNTGKTTAAHRLVAEHFVPNPDNKPFVNHIDSDRINCHAFNLEWCTHSENIQHGYDEGFMSQEAHKNFKDFELDLHLDTFLSGITMTAIAQQEGVGLTRLSINLRKRAEESERIDGFKDELIRQKQERNKVSMDGYRQAIDQYSLAGEYITSYVSMTAAAKALGKKTCGSISNALNPNHPQQEAFGYLWKLH